MRLSLAVFSTSSSISSSSACSPLNESFKLQPLIPLFSNTLRIQCASSRLPGPLTYSVTTPMQNHRRAPRYAQTEESSLAFLAAALIAGLGGLRQQILSHVKYAPGRLRSRRALKMVSTSIRQLTLNQVKDARTVVGNSK